MTNIRISFASRKTSSEFTDAQRSTALKINRFVTVFVSIMVQIMVQIVALEEDTRGRLTGCSAYGGATYWVWLKCIFFLWLTVVNIHIRVSKQRTFGGRSSLAELMHFAEHIYSYWWFLVKSGYWLTASARGNAAPYPSGSCRVCRKSEFCWLAPRRASSL